MLARTKKVRHQDVLKITSIQDFDGGWNVIDNDLSMRVKYSKYLDNMIRMDDGTLGVRWGTKEHVTLPLAGVIFDGTDITGEWIINMTYFQDFLVVVTSLGAIYAVDALGNYQEIWQVVLTVGGTWAIDTEVNYGEVWTDSADGSEWWSRRKDGSLTSSSGTFADERLANASWWGDTTEELYPAWVNSNLYSIGDLVTDVVDNSDWYCEQAHRAANNGNMADDRLANPSYWTTASTDGSRGWGETDFASFAVFHDHLIVCNGTDKPVKINFIQTTEAQCSWLVDEGTGSNANVPVAKYVMAMNDFVFMAGDVQQPDMLYVSSEGTSGTWVNDPDPNNAVNILISKKVSTNHPEIKGIARYREKIIIAFDEKLALGTPGVFVNEGTVDVPINVHDLGITDAIEAHGSISHRSMLYLGDDLFMCDTVGVPSIASTIFKETLTPDRPSELVDPEIQRNVRELSQGGSENHIFAVYNILEKQYMLFMPGHERNVQNVGDPVFIIADMYRNLLYVRAFDHNCIENETIYIQEAAGFNTITADDLNGFHTILHTIDVDTYVIQLPDTITLDPQGDPQSLSPTVATITSIRTETLGYVLSHRKEGKQIKAWSRFRGWNWQCGCRSLLGNIFFADYTTIYNYGNKQNRLHGDFLVKGDMEDKGTPIDWVWETPWSSLSGSSGKYRMNTKKFRYIGFDSKGSSEFNVDMFIDQIYKDQWGFLDPALTGDFFASEAGGYGKGSQSYGAGRRAHGERLYNWTTKAKLVKLRLYGSTTKPLSFVSILLAYMVGSIRR